MKIIGHRGAAGLALENTGNSLRAAKKHKVDAVELDVRLTADDRLVLSHDPTTDRVSDAHQTIRKLTLAQLQAIPLHNDERFLSLDEALDILGTMPVIIELKDSGSVDELLLTLERHPSAQTSITSFHHTELRAIRRVLPTIPIYVLEHTAPIDIVRSAHSLHATGIGLNKWLMNPLTYYLARRYRLEMYLYTVNNPLLIRFLRRLYPSVDLCTNRPDRFTTS